MFEHCDSCTCKADDQEIADVENAVVVEKNAEIERLTTENNGLRETYKRAHAGHLARADRLDAANAKIAALESQLDGRIRWQVEAVAHMQTWSGLFDAAVALTEQWPEGGCLTTPPCDGCRWCDFASAVDEAMKAVAAGSDSFIAKSDELAATKAELDQLKAFIADGGRI